MFKSEKKRVVVDKVVKTTCTCDFCRSEINGYYISVAISKNQYEDERTEYQFCSIWCAQRTIQEWETRYSDLNKVFGKNDRWGAKLEISTERFIEPVYEGQEDPDDIF